MDQTNLFGSCLLHLFRHFKSKYNLQWNSSIHSHSNTQKEAFYRYRMALLSTHAATKQTRLCGFWPLSIKIWQTIHIQPRVTHCPRLFLHNVLFLFFCFPVWQPWLSRSVDQAGLELRSGGLCLPVLGLKACGNGPYSNICIHPFMLLLPLFTTVSVSTDSNSIAFQFIFQIIFIFLIFVCIWYECVYVWMQAHGCHSVYVEVRGQSWMSVLTFHLDWDSLLFFIACTQCLLACELLVILFLPPFCCRSLRIVNKHHHAWLYMGPGIQIQVLIFTGQAFPQWIISQVPIILKYN